MIICDDYKKINTDFDFSEAVISGLKWDVPKNDLVLTLLYAWDKQKDKELFLRFVDCGSLILNLDKNIKNSDEFSIKTPWQEIDEINITEKNGSLFVVISSNIEKELIKIECRKIFIEE